MAGALGSGGPLGTTSVNKNVISNGGTPVIGGTSFLGGTFGSLFGKAPNAKITPPKVGLPTRADFGPNAQAPTIADPNRANYGEPSRAGIDDAAMVGRMSEAGFLNPRGTGAFKNLMGLANEQTGLQESERARQSADAAQRRGYAGGGEDDARQAASDKMQALASAGFQAADTIQQREGDQYGRAIGAFTQLQSSYNDAKSRGDIAFANDLTQAHIANAENVLKTAGLNMDQQKAYAETLSQAKQLQATLDEQYNNSLIDNNKYIAGQQQIAAQLLAQQMALNEKKREFDIGTSEQDKARAEQQREFDLQLKANPGTALRTFANLG